MLDLNQRRAAAIQHRLGHQSWTPVVMLDVADVHTRTDLGRSPSQQDPEIAEGPLVFSLGAHVAPELSSILAGRLENGFQEFFSE